MNLLTLSRFDTPNPPHSNRNRWSQSSLSSVSTPLSVHLSCDQRLIRGPQFRRHAGGPPPIHFVDVHAALPPLCILEHQQVAVSLVFGHFIDLVRLRHQNRG